MFGLGYKPTKDDRKHAAEERRRRKLEKQDGKELTMTGEVPPISVNFPKPACILQPGTPPPEPEETVEVSKLVNVPQDMREAFDYDEVPEEVLQWVFSQEEQVAMIRTLPSMSEGNTIRPATPGESLDNWVITPIPTRKQEPIRVKRALSIGPCWVAAFQQNRNILSIRRFLFTFWNNLLYSLLSECFYFHFRGIPSLALCMTK